MVTEPKKKKIAVFATGWACEILGQFLMGMTAELEDKAADLFLFLCYPLMVDTKATRLGQLNIFNLPDLADFDGVVIFANTINYDDALGELLARCEILDIPVIVQGMKHDHFYTLNSDNYHATRNMCEHLLDEHGVRDIVFFAGAENSYDSQIRLKAITDVLEERGQSDMLRDVFYTEWENARADKYIRERYAKDRNIPDAIMCANDGLAMQTCITLSRCGYSVPDEIIVSGFDHIDESQVFYPAICSVDQQFENIGSICVSLWYDLLSGKERDKDILTPCKFIPGESCGCTDTYNHDDIRRKAGRDAFFSRTQSNYFSRKLNAIDNTILGSESFEDFCRQLSDMYHKDHDYEGDSFHVLLESTFGQSLYDPEVHLRTNGYSRHMDVLYSAEDGVYFEEKSFPSRELVPGYTGTGENHLYVFLPIHSGSDEYGYVVFRDHVDKVYNHVLQTYQDRLSMAIDKFRRALRLNLLNEQLMEVMKRDPLTNVNNRTAYEAREKDLQAEIDIDENTAFGIVMLDINNLKTVNDTLGHDAGDMYIIRCCHLICKTFRHSPVFRMGGDEFLVILIGDDFSRRDMLIGRMKKHMAAVKNLTPTDAAYVSVACGLAVYDPARDNSVDDVVKRADAEMYRNKNEMKAAR